MPSRAIRAYQTALSLRSAFSQTRGSIWGRSTNRKATSHALRMHFFKPSACTRSPRKFPGAMEIFCSVAASSTPHSRDQRAVEVDPNAERRLSPAAGASIRTSTPSWTVPCRTHQDAYLSVISATVRTGTSRSGADRLVPARCSSSALPRARIVFLSSKLSFTSDR